MDDYQSFIHQSRYARWLEKEGRRETWLETVERYMSFMRSHLKSKHGYVIPAELYVALSRAIHDHAVMPSMRALMTAGPALERENVAGFNCAYVAVDDPRAFDEALYILLCGTGVGYSVERDYISKLPWVPPQVACDLVIKVGDSKKGWAEAYRTLLEALWRGDVPTWDMSSVRPAGSRLKTFGGRASGPEPLGRLFRFTVQTFKAAVGRRLNSIECHDLMCMVADTVVVGGVRRAAMISLSTLYDDRMRSAKSGEWFHEQAQPYRALANNSAVYTNRPDNGTFIDEWLSLYRSKSGERGIFNRSAAQNQAARGGRRSRTLAYGTNPCSEIILRSMQFCNLTEVVVREGDTLLDLQRKVKLATILGTYQSTLTNFRYIRKGWTKNTEEERLLGVSLTGIMDHPKLGRVSETARDWLDNLKIGAIRENAKCAKLLQLPPSSAITCVKPSGTVSQLVDTASGIHPRHSDYYIRTVRGDDRDPMSRFLRYAGVPCEAAEGKAGITSVFSFPIKAPKGARLRKNLSALEHLDIWKMYQDHWCEHKPSCTVSIREDEWIEVCAWVYRHFDEVSGISFLPYTDHIYAQAPYQEITKKEYENAVKEMPKNIDWTKLREYEAEDTTLGSQTSACTGDTCEIVDFTVAN
jgi:ribonucleoside-triphosphate reductase